ncbi:MAG: DUF354 domain-containing protein [Paludibacteraceae bacterium]
MEKKKVIWIDITNVPHVNFLMPIIEAYKDEFDIVYTIRDFAETKSLFEKRVGASYLLVGGHQGGSKLKKVGGMLKRIWDLQRTVPKFDVKISLCGDTSSVVAWRRRKFSITFDDNETSPNWLYASFTDLAFWPQAIPTKVLRKQLFSKDALYQYHGYKEDFYLADYTPNPDFLQQLPWTHYVVVRPENIKASYVGKSQSIVPDLLKALDADGKNILFLPRYDFDRNYAAGVKNVYIPEEAINGLDACYYADAILTGAGTMAREAACLGVPSVSFFAGSHLLTVDQSLINQGKMFFSRNVEDIIKFIRSVSDRTFEARGGGLESLARCKVVQKEILNELDRRIREYLNK